MQLDLRSASGAHYTTLTGAEGIFRLRDVQLGIYEVTLTKPGFKTLVIPRLELTKPELSTLELQMQELTALAPENKGPSGLPGTPRTPAAAPPTTPYAGLNGPAPGVTAVESAAEPIPPASANFSPQPDRWDTAMPEWRRYEQQRDAPYVKGRWYDPFNRNRLKGDYPIFGQRWRMIRTPVFQLHRHQRNNHRWEPTATGLASVSTVVSGTSVCSSTSTTTATAEWVWELAIRPDGAGWWRI